MHSHSLPDQFIDEEKEVVPQHSDSIEAHILFIRDLRLLIENDSTIQRLYSSYFEKEHEGSSGSGILVRVYRQFSQKVHLLLDAYVPPLAHVSLRVERLIASRLGSDTHIDTEHSHARTTYEELGSMRICGIDHDTIKTLFLAKKRLTKKNAQKCARAVFPLFKELLIQKAK